MTTYDGPATVIFPDGSDADGHSVLHADTAAGLLGWAGRVAVELPATLYPAFEAGRARIRLPDGREGDVVPQRFEPLGSVEVLEFTGAGLAPFGEGGA